MDYKKTKLLLNIMLKVLTKQKMKILIVLLSGPNQGKNHLKAETKETNLIKFIGS
jgi:hypothetical protein